MAKGHRHRRPLTATELAQVYDENPTPVVQRLLWEIYRLRSTIQRISHVRDAIGTSVGRANTPGGIWDLFEQDLNAEPCLTDPLTPRQLGKAAPGRER